MIRLNVYLGYFVHCLGGDNQQFVGLKEALEQEFSKVFTEEEANGDKTGEGKKEEMNGDDDTKIVNKIYCYCNEANSGFSSRQSLEIMFDNAYEEFIKYFEDTLIRDLNREGEEKYSQWKGVECYLYLTFVGHSLGGNVSRGLISKLYSPFKRNAEANANTNHGTEAAATTTTTTNTEYDTYFQYIQAKYPFLTAICPCSYMAICSPHLGSLVTSTKSSEVGGGDEDFMKGAEKFTVKSFTNLVVGDVGKELTFRDDQVKHPKPNPVASINDTTTAAKSQTQTPSQSKSILIRHTSEEDMEALSHFPHRTLIGNLRYDVQVKYCSAMGCLENPLPELLKREKEEKEKEKKTTKSTEILVDDGHYDIQMVDYSGFGQDSDPLLAYYQKEVFNGEVAPGLVTPHTQYHPEIKAMDQQIQEALTSRPSLSRNRGRSKSKTPGPSRSTSSSEVAVSQDLSSSETYDQMEDVFVIDNDYQQDIPVALVKKFNRISFRRVSFDVRIPAVWRLFTHGISLGMRPTLLLRPTATLKTIAKKGLAFYVRLLLADYRWTSGQTDDPHQDH